MARSVQRERGMRVRIILDVSEHERWLDERGVVWVGVPCPLCGRALVIEVDRGAEESDATCEACFAVVGRVVRA
jgi:hypothetical protein